MRARSVMQPRARGAEVPCCARYVSGVKSGMRRRRGAERGALRHDAAAVAAASEVAEMRLMTSSRFSSPPRVRLYAARLFDAHDVTQC